MSPTTSKEVAPVDYRALAELVLMGMLGLSVLVVALGFSIRAFLAPTLREIFERLERRRPDDPELMGQLERLDERMADVEHGLERLEAAQQFDRQLESPRE
jgi:hypothetical protein